MESVVCEFCDPISAVSWPQSKLCRIRMAAIVSYAASMVLDVIMLTNDQGFLLFFLILLVECVGGLMDGGKKLVQCFCDAAL